jgi:Leucine-rich repeat (LRR) protein
LEWLDLSATSVSDAGLAHLVAATKLKQLFLEGTKLTDDGLLLVGRLKALEELDLSRLEGISDEGLAALAGLKNLNVLHLSGSPISDAGLAHLRGLKQLQSLETTGTKVTPEGLQKLQAALPKLKTS